MAFLSDKVCTKMPRSLKKQFCHGILAALSFDPAHLEIQDLDIAFLLQCLSGQFLVLGKGRKGGGV